MDGVHPNIRDLDGLRENALKAKALGYQSKLAIHPAQVSIIQEIFEPSETEMAWANRVLVALQDAESQGLGAFTLDGKMIDYPVVRRAKLIVEKAKNKKPE